MLLIKVEFALPLVTMVTVELLVPFFLPVSGCDVAIVVLFIPLAGLVLLLIWLVLLLAVLVLLLVVGGLQFGLTASQEAGYLLQYFVKKFASIFARSE